jgi:hypothetical protein
MVEVTFDLGMSHFPTELRFIILHKSTFKNVCKYGRDIAHDKILSTLGQNNNTLHALVIPAVINGKLSLYGLYTIFRHDSFKSIVALQAQLEILWCWIEPKRLFRVTLIMKLEHIYQSIIILEILGLQVP